MRCSSLIYSDFTFFNFRICSKYRKIPKISLLEGLSFGGAYIWRGLSTEGNLRFKIDLTSLIVGSKFTVFALFYFVFEGSFLIFGGEGLYWRGLFSEFYSYFIRQPISTDFRSGYLKSPVLENVFSYTVHSLSASCR